MSQKEQAEPHIRVYSDRHEIYQGDDLLEKHSLDSRSDAAKKRSERIKRELNDGFLRSRLDHVIQEGLSDLPPGVQETEEFQRLRQLLDKIVAGISANRGRLMAVHTVLLLTIKAIEPDQSVRLHKSSIWKEGLPMRGIDSNYVSRELSDRDLVGVNRDGVMMTRTFAENLPYGAAYPANIKGPQDAWAEVIELLEANDDSELADAGLQHMLLALHNRGEEAQELNKAADDELHRLLSQGLSSDDALEIITDHIERSPHAARLLEVALHSLYQPLDEKDALNGTLKQLTQMRSADQKHGNVGDVEVVHPTDEFHVREAIDAKHGREPMTRELSDLDRKLSQHPETEQVIFVTTRDQPLSDDILTQCGDLSDKHDTEIEFTTLSEMASSALDAYESGGISASDWLMAYVESLTHQRRDVAPIDEPTIEWVEVLTEVMREYQHTQESLESF